MKTALNSSYNENGSRIKFIIKTLLDSGYEFADASGYRKDEPYDLEDVIGILQPMEREPRSRFFRLRYHEPSSLYLGRLWLNNEIWEADMHRRWVLELSNRKEVTELTKKLVNVVRNLVNSYKIKLEVLYTEDQPIHELSVPDYLPM